ncbi:hypothetical protein CMI39_03300 [Candidatus Pacearchaeota archaeon]|nr:hypothetical protein [Candidatus Pacearchaeota archaeon]|tara:strand:+ start:823 stop:2448 length:1626 start_codon:yes stop_codon:yes gene_type:complete
MEEKYVKFHKRGGDKALIELCRGVNPDKTIRELTTNCLDARVPNKTEDIVVLVNPYNKKVIISDNGIGIKYDKLTKLPTSVGYSGKSGDIDMRGEKAFGLLSFGSLGDVMHIITRDHEDKSSDYGYLRWEINESKEKIIYENKKLSSRDIGKNYYGIFPHGTRIIIDRIPNHIMDILTIPNLKNWLRTLYNPALRKGITNISLGRLDKRVNDMKTESLKEINYEKDSSSKLVDDIIPIKIKKEETLGELEVLLYIDPEAAYDKVAVYSKDVLVYESIAELPEFNKSPVFTSGKVSGYINDYFNKLILGRDGIDRHRNAFKSWNNTIKELEGKLRPIVEEKKKHGKKVKEDKYIKEVFDAMSDVWGDIKESEADEEYTRSKDGDLLPVKGTEPTKIRKIGPKKTRTELPTGRPPGPGSFKYDLNGHHEKVNRKKGLPKGYPQPVAFQASEMHLRSKSDDLLGTPTPYINSIHEDYKLRVDLRDPTPFKRYITELMAKETAYSEIRKREKEKKLIGDKTEIVNAVLQKEELVKFRTLKRIGLK